MFQLIYKTVTTFSGLWNTFAEWKSKRLSNKNIKLPFRAKYIFPPKLVLINNCRIRIEFRVSCLKQEKVTVTSNNVVNSFIIYELGRWSQDLNSEFILRDCLFGAAKLTKIADPDKSSYSEYGIGFDFRFFRLNFWLG